ncbi:DUF6777 domain-containing protein [Streptomyces sp. NPDC088124]|uniref:DUF6777 domain-containing protein n=1 Tax=Streptomyces sp. NPDC088124 TaxID=3154654 RepID=UPI00341B459D
MRSPIGRRGAVLAVLSVGVLITAGCGWGGGHGGGGQGGGGRGGGAVHGAGESAPSAEDLHFQPVAAPGPDPFTSSTAAPPLPAAPAERKPGSAGSPGAPRGPRDGDARGAATGARTPRALPGSTPGLYGGSPSASCDVERQVALLAGDPAKARAFARGAALGGRSVPDFLRGLTPVVVRADVRVTAHGYRDGTATDFQSVLQAGTAVMVDGYGMPRVRCAGGSPLGAPVAAQGSVSYQGEPWRGYAADRVVVITRAPRPLDALVIVDLLGHAWAERRIGTDGGEDKAPGTPPPYAPDADLTDPEAVKAPGAVVPDAAPGGARSAPPGPAAPSGAPAREGRPAVPEQSPLPADEVVPLPEDAPGGGPGGLPGDALPPPVDDLFPPEPDGPVLPDGPAPSDGPVLPDGPAGTGTGAFQG